MQGFIGEFIGTALLMLIGNGVVANVLLNKTKGHDSGWLVITFGWAMAVFAGVYASVHLGGSGHINPAVTIAFAAFSYFPIDQVIPYVIAQFLGAGFGAFLVWIAYKDHYDATHDGNKILATFCTSPEIRNPVNNIATEAIATFALVFGVLMIPSTDILMGTVDTLHISLLILGIIIALGGPTGTALNPARDLAPRIVHYFLPIAKKRDSDWSYAWIPVVGPLFGAFVAMIVVRLI